MRRDGASPRAIAGPGVARSETFKRQAVERVVGGGLPSVRVAEELGLGETLLRRWMKRVSDP